MDEARSNVVTTLSSYEVGVDAYLRASVPTPSAAYAKFRRDVLRVIPTGARMLELGSRPGRDAVFFEANRVEVHRTDGTPAFVERLRAAGHQAQVLDVTSDEFQAPTTSCSRTQCCST